MAHDIPRRLFVATQILAADVLAARRKNAAVIRDGGKTGVVQREIPR
jgi:hypothetical protein